MPHIILQIPTQDDMPVIPAAAQIVKLDKNMFIINGPKRLSEYDAKYTRYPKAFVWRFKKLPNAIFLIKASRAVLDILDPEHNGVTVQSLGLQWRWWRCDGTIPDEKYPGGHRPVTDKIVKFENGQVPDFINGTPPWELPNGAIITSAYQSIPNTLVGYNLPGQYFPRS